MTRSITWVGTASMLANVSAHLHSTAAFIQAPYTSQRMRCCMYGMPECSALGLDNAFRDHHEPSCTPVITFHPYTSCSLPKHLWSALTSRVSSLRQYEMRALPIPRQGARLAKVTMLLSLKQRAAGCSNPGHERRGSLMAMHVCLISHDY